MKRNSRRGVSSVEFAFIVLTLAPLLLGTGVMGINLTRTLQAAQLARDAGHMYARGMDFSQPGNQTILENIGSSLGLTAAGGGSAVLVLSALTYVDNAACTAAGAVDSHGNPSGCTNLGKWVFTQRLVLGNSSLRTSDYGSPLTSGPTAVTLDSDGKISVQEYVTKAGAVARFSRINPYTVTNGVVSGLPSGQALYIAEAGGVAMRMPPFANTAAVYAFGLF